MTITNQTMNLSECRSAWTYDETYGCWCLENLLYTEKATNPQFQQLSVFVPSVYLSEAGALNTDGVCGRYTVSTAPIVFENNAAGYMQMPHTWLGGPRNYAPRYLERGFIYVTCGCRGRESRNTNGNASGKAPATLVDFKTAIRFLRHNRAVLPGNWDLIISVGWSAGGAMSSLLGLTGDHPDFETALRENGAFMDESDAVFASQIYCPIVDLEHADMAYEWCFHADPECEDSPAGPAETMTSFQKALSAQLLQDYVAYVNTLGLRHPGTGEALSLNEDGRSGSFYDFLMCQLEQSASVYLSRLEAGLQPEAWSVNDYLTGNYTLKKPAKRGGNAASHHAGPELDLPDAPKKTFGELLCRPPEGTPFVSMEPPMEDCTGTDKRAWLSFKNEQASITSLDDYVLNHRRRMKPCTSFDKLTMDSGENQEFGTAEQDYIHFSPSVREALTALRDKWPEEIAALLPGFGALNDPLLTERVRKINPMNYIGDPRGKAARHFRIRVGSCDADTSFSIAMVLALKLMNHGFDTDYAMVWDLPHCKADYPGEDTSWIESIT